MQKQKMKHNKKRNTAFLYEALIKELTKSIVEKDDNRKNIIVSILKEHFSKGKILHLELGLYKSIHESRELKRNIAEKILFESKVEYDLLPKDLIFSEQTKVINKINKSLSSRVYSNFVGDYKNLASIAQIFNGPIPVKERVLLEEELIDIMCSEQEKIEKMKPVDNLVYKTFIKKFNDKYIDSLLKEQKELITNYIISFSDNGLSLKIFLNEELERIKDKISNIINMKELKEDKEMSRKTEKIVEKINRFKEKEIDKTMLSELLKIQYFVKEAQADV